MKQRFPVWLVVTALLMSTGAYAQEQATFDPENRFSAKLEFGLLGMTTNSSYAAIDPDEGIYDSERFVRIEGLQARESYVSIVSSFFLFDINYLLKDDLMLYVGTPFFDDSRRGLTFGVEKLFSDNSILDASVFLGGENQWKDPYLIQAERESTVSGYAGVTIDYDGLLGTGMNVNYTFQGIHVSDDDSGNRNPDLQRDGVFHLVEIGYRFFLDDAYTTSLVPSVFCSKDHRKGEAYRNRSCGAEIGFITEDEKNGFSVSGTVEQFDFDGVHPLFQVRRSDDAYTVKLFYTRKNLQGSNWYTRVGGAFGYSDSNIDFFRQKFFFYGISLGYAFE